MLNDEKMNQRDNHKVKFETIDYADMAESHSEALFNLYKSKQDGFLIKNFLSDAELSGILNRYNKMEFRDVANTSVGYTYPMIFAEFSLRNSNLSEEDLLAKTKEYFLANAKYDEEFLMDFGFNIKAKLDGLFGQISGGREIRVPNGLRDIGKYPFGNFRYLKPGGGGMAIHCGNYFQDRFRLFYSHLTQSAKVIDQMSYFVMIQEPETGGELEVFDMFWEDGQTKVDNLENHEVILSDGRKYYPDEDSSVGKAQLRPKPGDMILFQGGNIWHRITEILGSKPRITFGGFIAISIDETAFYYWS